MDNRIFAMSRFLRGDTACAVIAEYFIQAAPHDYEEFSLSGTEIKQNIGIGVDGIKRVREKLNNIGWITSKVKGLPAVTHYIVHMQKIRSDIYG